MDFQRHHLLWPRESFIALKPTKALRAIPELIPKIETDRHTALHRHIGMVVLPNYFMAERILKNFEVEPGDTLTTVDNLLLSAEQAVHHFSTRFVEREVGKLFIASIDAQRDYIREGLA